VQAARTVSLLEERHAAAQARVESDTIAKQNFLRNTFKCTMCLRVHHPEGSPLVLCDHCPKSFHVKCLAVEQADLSLGEWACPRCIERHELNKAKAKELQQRRAEALLRVAQVQSSS
jgi:hypothetical protein